jgi:hypothetical protein
MSIWSDATSFGSNFVDGVEHEFSSATHAAKGALNAFQNELNDTAKFARTITDKAEHQLELFGEGVVTGAILNPINGVEQIVNHVTGMHLPPLEFTNQAEVNNSFAGKFGEIAGTAIDFVLTDGAVSAIGGIEAASALSLGITGAIEGGVLTPSKETDGSSFFVGRLENAAIDAASFATMGGVGKAVAGYLGGGAGLVDKVMAGAVSNAWGGMAGGAVAAEGQALTQGRNATVNEFANSIVQNALLGAAFGAGSELGFAGVRTISDAVKGPIKPGDTVLPRVENASPRAADVAKLMEVKGNISSGFASDVVKAVGDLPPQVLKLLADNNVRISVAEKVADIDPSLVGQTPRGWKSGKWENANGYYDPNTKQVVITEKNIPEGKSKLVQSGRVEGTARHEIGHAVDDMLNRYSQTADFQKAYQEDLSHIPQNLQTRLDYYIQSGKPTAGASEAFADIFAALHGGASNASDTSLVLKYFPNTAKEVQKAVASLP